MAVLAGVLLLVSLVGAGHDAGRSDGTSPPVPRAAAGPQRTGALAVDQPASPSPEVEHRAPDARAPLTPSTPIRLTIAAIGVEAPLLALGSDSKGRPELPPFSMPGTAGWLRDSATPGAQGAAVLAGHVDTLDGPAVFWALSTVKAGAIVEVARLDGSTAVFTVDEVRSFPRKAFPSDLVYGPTRAAELRIITCGGRFDRAKREYTSNVILFAHLTGSH